MDCNKALRIIFILHYLSFKFFRAWERYELLNLILNIYFSWSSNDEAPSSRYSPERLSNRRFTDWISQRAREMQRKYSKMKIRLGSLWFLIGLGPPE